MIERIGCKGNNPWQQCEFIEENSEQLRELAAKGDHPWQQREFIEENRNRTSGITWTADVDASIMKMIKNKWSYAEIASELGNGLNRNDITTRWTRHLKESSGIIRPDVKNGRKSCITWTEDVHNCEKGWCFLRGNCIGIEQWPKSK